MIFTHAKSMDSSARDTPFEVKDLELTGPSRIQGHQRNQFVLAGQNAVQLLFGDIIE